MPREPASLAERSQDGEARAASSERRAGCPQRTSGDGVWAAPSHTNVRRRDMGSPEPHRDLNTPPRRCQDRRRRQIDQPPNTAPASSDAVAPGSGTAVVPKAMLKVG